MTSKERVRAALNHQEPDRVPVDFGGTSVTGIHVSCVTAMREYFGLDRHPVKVIEIGQMLGEIEEDLKEALGLDVDAVARPRSKWGYPNTDWKPWRMPDGLEVLVPGGFTCTLDTNGDVLLYPQGDASVPASARMPNDGYFFDSIIRQPPFDEEKLNPEDNLEEFGPVPEEDFAAMKELIERGRSKRRFVMAGIGGTGFGDIANVPAPGLRYPKGIRDITEWYISTKSRRAYVHEVFERQAQIALGNLARLNELMGEDIDALYMCGTDFGTQDSSFCSVKTFDELWYPHYRTLSDWIHKNTRWKIFKHSCGAVAKFIPRFIELGFEILNPVQCSAAGMDPRTLKDTYGDRVTFWGGGVDTQKTLPFGTPAEVRDEVLARCEVFARGGGFVFNAVHNVQARTPVENIAAMFGAIKEFNGRKN
jgi:hypothetical protein